MKKRQLIVLIFLSALTAIVFDFLKVPLGFFMTKPLTTLLIILLPVSLGFSKFKSYSKRLVLGLLCCLIGDFFLLFELYFILGLVFFLIGHLFFLTAFTMQRGWYWSFKVGFPLGFLTLVILILIFHNLNTLLMPVLIYISVIFLMSWQGIELAKSKFNPTFKYVGWAVSFFLFSDALLAVNKFHGTFPLSGVLILSTYWIAIGLLALSATKNN
jgi:uncharacterized membrane protein YhhN